MIGTVSAGVGAAALLAAVAVGLVIRSRRTKALGGPRPKLRQQGQLAEDSDVRYLRDEDDVQLDLTEATPTPLGESPQRQFANFERL